jgi:hypothetical protein
VATKHEVCPAGARALRHWRAQLLRHAGFSDELARAGAADARLDVHELIELVDRGCPPALALRILAPLDVEERL